MLFHSWNWIKRATLAAVASLLAIATSTSQAAVVFDVEAPGVQASTLPFSVVETFDTNLTPPGSYTVINSPVGTYTAASPGAIVLNADAYGGANQTRYIAVGAQSQQTSVELAFEIDESYFGFYWGALDSQNNLDVYHLGNLLLTINKTNLMPLLGNPAYFGNPNTGQNTSEPYFFLNIRGTDGTVFDKVVFRNLGTGTGFETDNHTLVPEPSSLLAACIGGIGLLVHRLRRRSVQA